MRRLERVCVGTNFSAESEAALTSTARLARSFGAEIELVNVVEPVSLYRKVISPIQSRLVSDSELAVRARERLEQVVGLPVWGDLRVHPSVRVGTPFAELIAHCRERDAQLLVVGTRSGAGLERVMLGSTAERVLRKATRPVLIAKKALPEAPRTVLVPTDFSDAGRPAVEEALALARRWGARLVFLHTIEPIAEAYVWPIQPGAVQMYLAEPEEIEPEWNDFLASLDLHGVDWGKKTEKGYATMAIVAVADQIPADLVVMGTHGRTGLAHALLGSVAERVTREAPCSVLTVRPEAHEFVLP